MTSNWYIGRNKQKFGPFSTPQLQQLITLGLVKSTEYVLEEGAHRWVVVTSVAGLLPIVDSPKKYWLSLGGKNQGPYPADQIRVGLMRRQVPADTLACVEGGKNWTALAQLAEFRASVPAAARSSNANLGKGSSHLDLTEEEAELHLAGKEGDTIARLISSLLDMRRRYQANPSMVDIIERNIQDLKTMRERSTFGATSANAGPAAGNQPKK
jgi:uncharacterized protein DUF4339